MHVCGINEVRHEISTLTSSSALPAAARARREKRSAPSRASFIALAATFSARSTRARKSVSAFLEYLEQRPARSRRSDGGTLEGSDRCGGRRAQVQAGHRHARPRRHSAECRPGQNHGRNDRREKGLPSFLPESRHAFLPLKKARAQRQSPR